ncbi:type II toxin-antitoxin system Phd/YefM family antitoxin [Candidatus Halobeggiatoa sp. HSG11]|nr:type II toxin-antitoxin system Phd/YefM family antitoxin [Candidatus Halobeggiatoa sp. HSG11]
MIIYAIIEEIMRTVTFNEVENDLKYVLDQVSNNSDYTIIARNKGLEDVVMMSLETFNGYMETLHLLSSPANAAHLKKSIEQYRNGEIYEKELIDE